MHEAEPQKLLPSFYQKSKNVKSILTWRAQETHAEALIKFKKCILRQCTEGIWSLLWGKFLERDFFFLSCLLLIWYLAHGIERTTLFCLPWGKIQDMLERSLRAKLVWLTDWLMVIGWNMNESGSSWRMSISCCVAEIVQKCSEIKTRSNVSKYKRRNVSDAFFNYWPFTLFKRCGLKLVFIPHSVKSFDFSLWDSMSFACPLIERQLWLLTINYSKNQRNFDPGNFLIFMFFTPTCPATLCLVCSRKCHKNSQEKSPYDMKNPDHITI